MKIRSQFAFRFQLAALTLAVFAGSIGNAQTAPAAATPPGTRPANATGICKDGTYSVSPTKSGACRGHHGVQEWYTVSSAVPATPATSATPPLQPVPTTAAAPSPTTQARTQNQAAAQSAGQSETPPATQSIAPTAPQAAPATSAKKGSRANLANTPVAPGGGPGLVWVNTSSNVYHCAGTDYYGKTRAGSYMSEADAKAKGAHGVHGKSCGN
jgi:hypothetical protein